MHAWLSLASGLRTVLMAVVATAWTSLAHADSYYLFEQRSEPQGIFAAQSGYYPVDTLVQTTNAPPLSSGYAFAFWTTNGIRSANPLGQSLNQVDFSITTNISAIAWYLSPTLDTDADGCPDYIEKFYYGSLTNGPSSDFDADGFTHAEELARGYSPVVRDDLADGGILLRASALAAFREEGQKQRYEIRSDPQGIVAAQSGYMDTGTPVLTPALQYGFTNNYHFGYWEVNGVRQSGVSGAAQFVVSLPMTNDVVAIARFFAAGDSDGDGLADWQEWNWFGHLDWNLDSDPDGDGFVIREELARGYSPVVRDDLADGGILLRASALAAFREEGQKKRYEIRSDPQGIVAAQSGYMDTGTPVLTPALQYGFTNNYYFGYWEVNGVRQSGVSGAAQFVVSLPMTNDVVAIARFFAAGDGDNDGLADWQEWNWFGNRDQNLDSDPDGDGFVIREELARGYSPVVRDDLADGGILLRASALATFRDEGQKKRYEIRSEPQGIVAAQSGYLDAGTPVLTPAIQYGITNNYFFGYWEVNGVRQSGVSGAAQFVVSLPMTNDVVAIARFFAAGDGDNDGLADWQEWNWFGNRDQNLDSDPDGDGFAIREELARGYSPVVRDDLADGGILLRASALATASLSYYPRITEVMVDGSQQVAFAAAGGVARVLSVASNAAPALGDWDGDWVPDLLVGGANGQLRSYHNGGSPRLPNFIEDDPPWAAFAGWWTNLNNLSPALGDWSGDGVADLALGGQTNAILLINSLGLDTNSSPAMNAVWLAVSHTTRASPCLHPVSGTGRADLWVLQSDGTVDLYLNTGSLGAPFSVTNRLTNILGTAVADATGIAVADVSGDGRPDVLISDQYGSIAEFRAQTNGTFAARGKGFAGTYSGFAERLTVCAGDLDGDGDTDFLGGFAQGGLVYLNNPMRHLLIDPPNKTVMAGNQTSFGARNASGSVTWSFLRDLSGGTINPTNGTYRAGEWQALDVIEAVDGSGLRGRAYANVINSNDVARAGKAIIVSGRASSTDPVWVCSDYLANFGYNALLYCGYGKENIHYLSPVPGRDTDGDGLANDITAASTFANLAQALTNWTGNASKLFFYLVDHGGEVGGQGYFRLNPNETLSAVQLDAWLDALQDRTGVEVCVVVDCCNSGSFLDELTYAGPAQRIVIAACASDEPTIFAAGGLVSFSESFFSALMMGQNLRDAFAGARSAMVDYQNAQLDDNQDGVHTVADGLVAASWTPGGGFIAGKDVPQIGSVLGNVSLNGDVGITLWADAVVSSYPIQGVWCVVVPPSYHPNPTNPVVDLPQLFLAYNPATGRYEGSYTGFAEVGTYKVYYYAQDIWGSLSKPRQGAITQTGFKERVIMVVAGSPTDPKWSTLTNLAGFAFQAFENRRLNPASIWVGAGVDCDLNGDGTNDVAGENSLALLGSAITNWGAGANKLTIYLLGKATNETLALNASERLTPSQLAGWLEVCQHSNTQVAVIMDFDGCGSWLMPLRTSAKPLRLCIASCPAGLPAALPNGGLVSFSSFFFNALMGGADVWNAFAIARDNIFNATRLTQRAQMDGDGDGSYIAKKDRLVAQGWYIGSAFMTGGDAPTIDAVTSDLMLTDHEPVTLWADGVADLDGIANVWCVITPPDYDGVSELPQVNLPWNAATSRYEAVFTNFTLPGTYVCTFFAVDVNGAVSAPKQTQVLTPDAYEVDDAFDQAADLALSTVQAHNFHTALDEDWVRFYAPTGLVYNIAALQLGTNSDLALELYAEQPDGTLTLVDWVDDYGWGEDVTESMSLDLKTGLSGCTAGIYYLRVSSADTNGYGPGSEYEVLIYEPTGGAGGVVLISNPGGLLQMGSFYVYLGSPRALAAGASWRLTNVIDQTYFTNNGTLYSLPASSGYTLTFQNIPGFQAPPNRPLVITADQITSVMAYYTYTNLSPQAENPVFGTNGTMRLSFLAYAGKRYAIEESTNLLTWLPLLTNQVPADGVLRLNQTNSAQKGKAFFRARWVP